MSIEQIYSILGIITNVSYIPIFLIIVFSGAVKKNIWFALYLFLFSLWWYADYLMGMTEDYMPIWRIYNFCTIILPLAFFGFTQDLTKKKVKKLMVALYIIAGAFLFLNYYQNLLIPDVMWELTGWELFRAIPLYNIFVVYACALIVLSTYWIVRYYTWNPIVHKWLIASYLLTCIGEIYSYGTVYVEALYNYPYIAYFVNFLPYFMAYLVFQHRLFDARSMLLQVLRWMFIGWSGVIAGFILYWLLGKYGFISHFEIALLIVDLIPMIIIFLLSKSHRIRSIFRLSDVVRLENDAFNFTASSTVYTSNKELSHDILTTLQWGLKIADITLLGRDELKKYPKIAKALAFDTRKIRMLSLKEGELEEENGNAPAYMSELKELGELCIPIYIEKTLAYIFVLPEKNSQAPYTNQERKIIITLRPKITLSLQILEYNKSLRDEVDHQTEQINQQKKELEISYKKLEALDHEKDVFMNMAAHELRTPMTIIRWYADILLSAENGGINAAQKKLVENMLKSSESLIALVNDLLDLSRIDAWKMELKYEVFDIADMVQSTFENFSTLMAKKSMNFSLKNTIDTDKAFSCDKWKIALLFNNIISNAYKYTPEKWNVVWEIGTTMKGKEPWLTFSVQDSWVGIPEAELPHVFDRFASISTHNNIASTIQSTGLGLSIVKKIVVKMGWDIDVTSTVGKWSTFSINLPYQSKESNKPKAIKS